MRMLDLSQCGMDSDSGKYVIVFFVLNAAAFRNLIHLDLSHNLFDDDMLSYLGALVDQRSKELPIKVLQLAANKLS